MVFVSIPTLLDSSLAPEGKHIIHAFTPSSINEWEGLTKKEYLQKKEKYFSFLVKRISTILPNLEDNIDHKEIELQKHIESFLEDMKVAMAQSLLKSYLDFFQCHLTLQKSKTSIA